MTRSRSLAARRGVLSIARRRPPAAAARTPDAAAQGAAAGAGQRRRRGREGHRRHDRVGARTVGQPRAADPRRPQAAACPGASSGCSSTSAIASARASRWPPSTAARVDAQADAMAASVNVAKAGARERRGVARQRGDSNSIAPASCSRRAPCRASGSTPPRRRTAPRVAQRELAQASLAQAEAALRRAREVQRDATLVSPVAGHVVERNYDPGAIPGDDPVVVVADLRHAEARSRRLGARGRPAEGRPAGRGRRAGPARRDVHRASWRRSPRKSTSATATSASRFACPTPTPRCSRACTPPRAS